MVTCASACRTTVFCYSFLPSGSRRMGVSRLYVHIPLQQCIYERQIQGMTCLGKDIYNVCKRNKVGRRMVQTYMQMSTNHNPKNEAGSRPRTKNFKEAEIETKHITISITSTVLHHGSLFLLSRLHTHTHYNSHTTTPTPRADGSSKR